MLAVREGHSSIVEILLAEPGIDVTRRDVNGSTALHLACRYGRVDLVQQLLVHPGGLCCLEWQDKWGETPLLTATRKGHLLCVKRLLQIPGIHLATKDGRDKGLVDVARETGNTELVDSLRKAARTRGGEAEYEELSLSNQEERRETQSTERLDNIDGRKQQETVTEVESANKIKQEKEDDGERALVALPEDQFSKKRKRSPFDENTSLRENKDGKRSRSGDQEFTEKPNKNEEETQTFINYNHSVRKLLHSDNIPTDVIFKVFEHKEDSNATARRWSRVEE